MASFRGWGSKKENLFACSLAVVEPLFDGANAVLQLAYGLEYPADEDLRLYRRELAIVLVFDFELFECPFDLVHLLLTPFLF